MLVSQLIKKIMLVSLIIKGMTIGLKFWYNLTYTSTFFALFVTVYRCVGVQALAIEFQPFGYQI